MTQIMKAPSTKAHCISIDESYPPPLRVTREQNEKSQAWIEHAIWQVFSKSLQKTISSLFASSKTRIPTFYETTQMVTREMLRHEYVVRPSQSCSLMALLSGHAEHS